MKPLDAQQYPSRRSNPELICVLTPQRPAVFPPKSNNDGEARSMLDAMAEFYSLMPDKNIEVISMNENGMELEFDVNGVEPCIVNALRRSLLSEVPSMAPETVLMMQNTSVFSDDMIGSRLGLIPFRADPRRFKFRPIDNKSEHPDYTILFELAVPPTRPDAASKKVSKNLPPSFVKVHSRNLKYLPHPSFPLKIPEQDLRPVDEDILLASLLPAQELQLRIHVVKGIGKDHAKFSPVATASYRPRTEIRLLKDVDDENAKRLQDYFPVGVIGIEQKDGHNSAFVKNSRLYSGGRKIFEDDFLKSAVQIGFRENEFTFSVESVGALRSSIIVQQAIEILKKRCEYFALSLDDAVHEKLRGIIKIEEDS